MTQPQPFDTTKVRLDRLNHFSPEQMASVIESAQAEHLQLGRGAFGGEVIHVMSGGKALDSGCYTQSILGHAGMPAERVTFGMVIPAQTGGFLEGRCLDLPNIFLYTERAELGCRLEPGTRWVCFQVERQEIEACGLGVPESYRGTVRCGPEQLKRLSRVAATVLADLMRFTVTYGNSSRSARSVEDGFDALLAAFIGALSPEPSQPLALASRNHRQLVGRARDYMKAHLSDKVRIRDICTTLGVSYKTLERAFGNVLGVSPRQFLSLERLANARRMLLDANRKNVRVADVALACGHDEFGRFSRDYLQWFGEHPSQTLSHK